MSAFSFQGARAFATFASVVLFGAGAAQAAINITSVALDTPGGRNGTVFSAPSYSATGGIGRIRLTGTNTETNAAISYLSYCLDIFTIWRPPSLTRATLRLSGLARRNCRS